MSDVQEQSKEEVVEQSSVQVDSTAKEGASLVEISQTTGDVVMQEEPKPVEETTVSLDKEEKQDEVEKPAVKEDKEDTNEKPDETEANGNVEEETSAAEKKDEAESPAAAAAPTSKRSQSGAGSSKRKGTAVKANSSASAGSHSFNVGDIVLTKLKGYPAWRKCSDQSIRIKCVDVDVIFILLNVGFTSLYCECIANLFDDVGMCWTLIYADP